MKNGFLLWTIFLCVSVLPLHAQWRVRAVSTGRTTGHIADLHLKNGSDRPRTFVPSAWLIPPKGPYQGYVLLPEESEPIVVQAGASVVWPLREGYCTDIHRPPVPEGKTLPPFEQWVALDELPPWTGAGGQAESVPWVPLPSPSRGAWRAADPATGRPLRHGIDFNRSFREAAPLLSAALQAIRAAVDEMYRSGGVPPTPFAAEPAREREALIQQTFWRFTSLLHPHDEDYARSHFARRIRAQYAHVTGKEVEEAADPEQRQLQAGIDAFWSSFEVVGMQAKVLAPAQASAVAKDEPRRCLRWGEVPQIEPRTGFDLIGDLYRMGKLSFDLNHVRFHYRSKIDAARSTLRHLDVILSGRYVPSVCEEERAYRPAAQRFPPFPWEDVFLTVDFCDSAHLRKNRLSDFLDSHVRLEALEQWYTQLGQALENFGLPEPYQGSYFTYFDRRIERAQRRIVEAYARFDGQMEVAMALRYNRSRATDQLWQTAVFATVTVASAGLAMAGGGGAALLASVFASTTGFVTEHGLRAMGADPQLAEVVAALTSLSIGLAASVGQPLRQITEEALVSESALAVLEEGLDAMQQRQVRSFALSMAVLDDGTWSDLLRRLAEDYDSAALDQFERYRQELHAEVSRALRDLCAVRRSLRELLPATERAWERAAVWLSAAFWRRLWLEAMDRAFDCCCAYSGGTGPSVGCVVSVPPFGFEPEDGR